MEKKGCQDKRQKQVVQRMPEKWPHPKQSIWQETGTGDKEAKIYGHNEMDHKMEHKRGKRVLQMDTHRGTGYVHLFRLWFTLQESVYQFEPVVEGTQVTHEFILCNQGDEPLKIFHVKSG